MSDFMLWLHAHYIKPYVDSCPKGNHEFWMSLLQNDLIPEDREALDKTLEYTAVHAFLLGLRTEEGLSSATPR